MGVTNVVTLPPGNGIVSAYRPIELYAQSNNANSGEVVYCDIYFNGTYYKTIALTPNQGSFYLFDIQDAAQEFLRVRQTFITQGTFLDDTGSIAACFCRFRGSSISGGIITPDGPIPVQGTAFVASTPGGGWQSSTFYVVNSVLQHEDSSSLETHLDLYRTYPIIIGVNAINPGNRIYPLSHAPYIEVYNTDVGYFPFVIANLGFYNGFTGLGNRSCKLVVWGVNHNNTVTVTTLNVTGNLFHNTIYYIPYGIPTLSALPNGNTIVWSNYKYYWVQLYNDNNARYVFSTPKIYMKGVNANRKRIRFLNYLGAFDTVNFDENMDVLKTTSAQYERPRSSNQWSPGKVRIANSSKFGTITGVFQENQMAWLEELFASPLAFMEVPGITPLNPVAAAQQTLLIPIKMVDGEMTVKKFESEGRYQYLVQMQYEKSHENIHQRVNFL